MINISIDMGLALFFIAIILYIPLTIINGIVVTFKYGFKWSTFNGYFRETAIDIDRFGNRNLRALLNETLQKNGYKFGDDRETISSALGKNLRDGTLTITGKLVCRILDFLDKNHCLKSIKNL